MTSLKVKLATISDLTNPTKEKKEINYKIELILDMSKIFHWGVRFIVCIQSLVFGKECYELLHRINRKKHTYIYCTIHKVNINVGVYACVCLRICVLFANTRNSSQQNKTKCLKMSYVESSEGTHRTMIVVRKEKCQRATQSQQVK